MSGAHNTMCPQGGLRIEVIASHRENGAAVFAIGIREAHYRSAMVVWGGFKSLDLLCIT